MVRLFSEVLGKEVEVPESPQRIVSFSPAATETLYMLGMGDRLAGVSAFCARPPEASSKRKVGSYNTVSPDLLRELRPDLIFTVTGYQREFAVRLSSEWPVYPLELPVSVAGIIDFVEKVGLVVGAPSEVRELAGRLLRQVPAARGGTKLRAYVEIDLGGPVTFGAHSYITDAFRLLGASTLFEKERCEWLTPPADAVQSMDPDLIVYEPKMYSKFGPGDLEKLVRKRGWGGSRAVKIGNCFQTPGPIDFLAHHGPSFVTEALPWLDSRLEDASRRS